MKQWKKILSFSLVLVLIMNLFVGVGMVSGQAVSAAETMKNVDFHESFSGNLNAEWESENYGHVYGGLYHADRYLINRYFGAQNTADYYVQADVTFNRYFDGENNHTGFSGIAARYDATADSGYELAVGAQQKEEALVLRFAKRVDGQLTDIQILDSVGTVGDTVSLRLSVYGSTILCYADGKLIYETQDTTFTAGLPAIVNGDAQGVYDNFIYNTFAPQGYNHLKILSFSGDSGRNFAASADWAQAFTFNGVLKLEKPLATNSDIYGNEIEVNGDYWDSDETQTTANRTPVYGNVLGATAVATATVYTRGDLQMEFTLTMDKTVSLTIYKGQEVLYTKKDLGSNRDFAIAILSAPQSVGFSVDGNVLYTYTANETLQGATGLKTNNAVGRLHSISFTDSDIIKTVVPSVKDLTLQTGTPLNALDLSVAATTLKGNTYTAKVQEVADYNNTPGDHLCYALYDNFTLPLQLYVRDDISKIAIDNFESGSLLSAGWNAEATNAAVNFADGAYVPNSSDTKYIAKSTNWQNAYVQADVTYLGKHAESTVGNPFVGIFARRNTAATKNIEFALISTSNSDKLALRVYLRGSGAGASSTEYQTAAIYEMGVTYTLRLEVCGGQIRAYANDVLIFDIGGAEMDITDAGAVGIINNGAAATVDNLLAETLPADYFGDASTGADQAINDFVASVGALRYASATAEDVSTVSAQYDALTDEQKVALPSYTAFKYQHLLVKSEKNTYGSAITNSEAFLYDDFTDDLKWPLDKNGKWIIEDGQLYLYKEATEDKSYSGELLQKGLPAGVIQYISAEFTITEIPESSTAYIGFLMSNSENGSFHARLCTNNNQLQLYRSVNGAAYSVDGMLAYSSLYNHSVLGAFLGTNYDYSRLYTVGTKFKLTCIVTETQLLLYLNDGKDSTDSKHASNLVLTYNLTDVDKSFTTIDNTAGLRIIGARVTVDDIMIMGTRSEGYVVEDDLTHYAEQTGTYTPGTYYYDDFETETVGKRPGSWLQNTQVDNWLVKHEGQLDKTLVYAEDFSGYTAEGVAPSTWPGNRGTTALVDGNMAYRATAESAVNRVSGIHEGITVEAKVKIDYETSISTSNTVTAAIIHNGFAFGLQTARDGTSTAIRFYDHSAGKQLFSQAVAYDPNTYHTLRMEFKNNTITCYLDDIRYVFIDNPGTSTSNTTGVRSSAFAMFADDFKVLADNDTASGNKVYVYNPQNAKETLSWLHMFDPSPIISAKLMVEQPQQNARVGVMTRYAVENSYVKAGYDFAAQKWFMSYTAGVEFDTQTVYAPTTSTLTANEWVQVDLVSTGSKSYLSVNGELVLTADVSYVGYGRVGLFAENTKAAFDDVYSYSPQGATYDSGVTEQQLYGTGNYGEIEELDDGRILVSTNTKPWFISPAADDGRNFISTNPSLPFGYTALGYISTIKVRDANGNTLGYISVANDYTSAFSTDFVTWETRAHILPNDEENRTDESIGMTPGNIRSYALTHISSFTQVILEDGTVRVFMPIGIRFYENNNTSAGISGHFTRVFYTDDLGVTWQESENDTRDLLQADGTPMGDNHNNSFCESKIIRCADGSLRMYCTRKWDTCVYYAESLDNGVTWSSWGSIPSMPCAVSSFGISEDPTAPGTYYMAYVKNIPYTATSALPRNTLMLVKTTNGKDWEEVMVIDRYTSTKHPLSSELYQFLDPNVLVTEDYIYVTYGRSDSYKEGAHNHQTTRLTRIERGYSVTVDSDMQEVISLNTNKALKGDTISVTLNLPADTQLKAGSLKAYSADRANSMKIISQPAFVSAGSGKGNVFEFKMPASDLIIDAELIENLSTQQTNFNIAVLAASYKSNASGTKDGMRYLSRMYLPSDGKGNLRLDVRLNGKDYTIVNFGSLYAKTSALGSTPLDMAAVQSGVAKLSEAFPNGKLYDLNASYVDYTIRLIGTTEQLQEYYSVRSYVQLQDADGNTVYVYSDDTISRSGLNFK